MPKLRKRSLLRVKIGTVSPFSNNAGAFSAPIMGIENNLPEWLHFDQYTRLISQTSHRRYPAVPTNHGFCMYVRRDCLEDIGVLDEEAFPRGYGEENDFCMRARGKGWKHVIDDATLVYHARSASFGEAKKELLKQGRAVVDLRYPDYKAAISIFREGEEINECRRRIGVATAASQSSDIKILERVLYVVSTRTGGTPQTNQDLMSALSDDIETFILWCNHQKLELKVYFKGNYFPLETFHLKMSLNLFHM